MYTEAEEAAYYNAQPTRQVDGAALVLNSHGQLLILKPTYKQGWMLVGGCSEEGESALEGLRREVREEIGLDLDAKRFTLAGVRDVAPHGTRHAHTQLYFKIVVTDEEASRLRYQASEIAEHRFVDISELSGYGDSHRMQAVIALFKADRPAYLVDQTVIA